MSRVSVSLAVALVATAGPVRASGTPMDQARWDAWNASHIVVTDMAGKVLEVWKGDLKPGDTLPVDKKTWRVPVPQVVRHAGGVGGDIEGRKVVADRVLLFLQKAGKDRPDGIKPGEWVGLRPYFVSAGEGGVFAQVYAIEGGVQPVYAVSKSEAAFKAEYLPLAERRTALDAALAEPDPKTRAEKLRPFATDPRLGMAEAMDALAGCGEAGVGPLAAALFRRDWGDNPFAAEDARGRAIKSLVKIGKPAAGELVKFLELQRAYWTLTGPDLGPNWYDDGGRALGVQLRLLFDALADPGVYADLPADKRAVIRDLHHLWTRTPALAGVKTAGDRHPAKLLAAIMDRWEKK